MERVRLEKYFSRIGLTLPEVITPDSALLRALQFAHCTHVPYENLDIIRGVPLSLDEGALYDKIVAHNRGGFCFELNGLFACLLRALGYGVTEYAARYLRGESEIPMRRHRVLCVEATDGVWCVDVGIGEVCPRYPVRLVAGVEQPQFDECYRFTRDDFLGWVLEDRYQGEWRRFYSFTEEPQLPQDFEALCLYCEKSPKSPFFPDEIFSMKTPEGRYTLDGHLYKEIVNGQVSAIELDESELPWAYARFGLEY